MSSRWNSLCRVMVCAVALLVAAQPASARPLDMAAATRLQLRSGLGPDPALSAAWQGQPGAAAVAALVDAAAAHQRATTPPPPWVDEPALPRPGDLKALTDVERKERVRQIVRRGAELQEWWMTEMLTTPAPLTERMTLFWHGHFTSGLRETRAPQLLYRQNVMLRQHALGNYRELLLAVVHDPAMLLYLDNQKNRSDAPNENFARELLELFTLGEGNYTEQDVREAARAFTGWKALPPDGTFAIVRRQHDAGPKSFLGAAGNFDGDDIVAQILRQPQAAEFIVAKLWREFVSPQPDPRQVRKLAATFRADWEIAPLVKALLRLAIAQDERDAGQLVKSPVEFVVGTVRSLDLPLPARAAARATRQLGQSLFAPPNVRGWPGGTAWITTQSLLARRQFLQSIGRDVERVAETHPPGWAEQRLLPTPPLVPAESGATPAARLTAVLLDPTFHLK